MIAEAGLLVRRTQFVRSKLEREPHHQNSHAYPAYSPIPHPTPTASGPHNTHVIRLPSQVPPTTQTACVPVAFPHNLSQLPVLRWPPRGMLWHPRPPRPAARGHGHCHRWPSDPALRRQPTAQILPAQPRAAPALLLKATPFRSSLHLLLVPFPTRPARAR